MKRFMAFLLCVLLLGSLGVAYAAEGTVMQILDFQQNEDVLDILLYARDDAYFSYGDFAVKFGKTDLPSEGLKALSKTEYGTSWIVVMEPATRTDVAAAEVELVEHLVESLSRNDNLAVYNAATGEMTAFVSDMPTIRSFVKDACAPGKGNSTRLYDAIYQAVNAFTKNEDVRRRQCLLVISGCTDTDSAHTLNEVRRLVEKSPISVYTVGINRGYRGDELAFEDFKVLSDVKPSGYAFLLGSFKKGAGTQAAEDIAAHEGNCYVLTASVRDLPETATDTLRISLGTHETKLDNITLIAPERPEEVVEPTPEPDPTPTPDPETCEHVWGEDATCEHARTCVKCGTEDPEGKTLPHEDDGSGQCKWCGKSMTGENIGNWIKDHVIVVVMGGVLLVLLIVLLIVLLSRKKAKKKAAEQAAVEDISGGTVPVLSKVTVELTNKRTGDRYSGEIFDTSLVAGLESPLKLAGDSSISRRHMEFIWQNGILYVQDANSLNGTYVNGKKITGAIQLHQNAEIHAGESDFYVTWHSNR